MTLLNPIPARFNIRTRMLLVCLGVAAPLLAIGSFSLWKEYGTLRQEAQRATMFQATITGRTLNQWLLTQTDAVRALAALPAMQSLKSDTVQKILNTALEAQNGWSELTVFDSNGVPTVSTAGGKVRANSAVAAQVTASNFLQRIAATRRPQVSDYAKAPMGGTPAILVGAPILVHDELRGALVASIRPNIVLRLFSGLGENSGNIIAVVDQNKRVICRTLQNDYWQGKDFSHAKTVTAAQQAARGTIEVVGIADPTPRAYAFEHVSNGWLVIVGVPTEMIYGAAHDWLAIMVVLAVCAIVVSVLLAYWATTHFTSTIQLLVREALAIGRGDFTKRVKVPAKDELGMLARAFNEMAERLEIDQDHKFMVDRLSESIRHSLDLEEILNTTVRELGTALEASRVCLALLDTHSTAETSDDELVFNHVWHNTALGGAPLNHKSILITQNSMMSMILEQGSILSLDVLDDRGPTPLFENSDNSPDDWRSIRSLIACPITTNSGSIGLILVHQCDRLRMWMESELEMVEAVTRHVALAMEHGRLYNRTKTMAEQEMLINHIVRSVRSSLDLDTILNTVTRELGLALGVDRCQIAQPRSEGPLVVTHEFHQDGLSSGKGLNLYPDNLDFHPNLGTNNVGRSTLLGINLPKLAEHSDDDLVYQEEVTYNDGDTLREAPIAIIGNVFEDSRALPFTDFLGNCGSQSLIAAPLLNEKRLVGVLIVHQCGKLREWKTSEIQLVAAIADQVAVAITHAHLFAQVKHQAITDGLTGLYNHIYFKNRLGEELRMAQRKNTSCSLLMIDLDKLKLINDKFGHPVGDAAIRQVATILKTLLRSGDTAARYGGEEFAVILPETSLLEAALIADRLCAQIRGTAVPRLGHISASIGAASYPKHAGNAEDLVERADQALYVAKNSGRDQVRLYETPQQPVDFPSASSWMGESGEHEINMSDLKKYKDSFGKNSLSD
ncbi:MAG TPA: diguanylate cyclase [Planktothrix sp.]|jgi:diguanylate cyclase (GGDEF)-like protein